MACEHSALEVLNANKVAAARSSIIDAAGRRFLEVARFDRSGLHGRLTMVTLSGLDGALGMLDQKWAKVAAHLYMHGQISADDKSRLELLDLFGYLIGNTDRHHGNVAFSWDQNQQFKLLPIYDMLPMFYRPNQHGEVVENRWSATNVDPALVRHLPVALALARQFWDRVAKDESISDDFKLIAANHVDALNGLNVPTLE